jgi:hypothetical protein
MVVAPHARSQRAATASLRIAEAVTQILGVRKQQAADLTQSSGGPDIAATFGPRIFTENKQFQVG